jgi:hypothetical protein
MRTLLLNAPDLEMIRSICGQIAPAKGINRPLRDGFGEPLQNFEIGFRGQFQGT